MTGPDTPRKRLPGDPSREALVERILRVDHAGEYGAVRIYAGQLAVLGDTPAGRVVTRMAEQEKKHLAAFDRLLPERRVRPTLLSPLWHVAGFAMGAATALLGPRAAMACTVAVEEVIDEHYAAQIEALGADEPALTATIAEFRQDEIAHRDEGLAQGARQAPGYEILSVAIKAASRAAIWLSTRV
jgi:ubiquinone biosynthesis monooxygenase Coq7